jgi:hypothetical protein
VAAQVNFHCPTCGAGLFLPLGDPAARATCGACGNEARAFDAGTVSPGDTRRPLERCAACGSASLFVQRDFNRKLGLGIVAVAALLAVPTRGLSLLVAVLADLALYRLLGRITVCFACDAVHRGVPVNPAHGAFDHHVADAFKVEKSERQAAARRWRSAHAARRS